MGDYPAPVDKLLALGDPRKLPEEVDYPQMGIGRESIPALVQMATDEALYEGAPESPEIWAPVHAWRALGQLRAEEAVEPLLGLLPRLDEGIDEWIQVEIPEVFGRIGPTALPALSGYLADESHGLWARLAAAEGIEKIGKRHPEARGDCVSVLSRQLTRFDHQDPTINSFLVTNLLHLDAVEAAPLMEQAFAAGAVDESIPGDWEDVQIDLGLIPARLTPRPRYVHLPGLELPELEEDSVPREGSEGLLGGRRSSVSSSARAKDKAKRKQAARSRRRNRPR